MIGGMDRLSCEETFRRLNDYLDRELTAEEMRLVRAHLHECAVCAREFRFEESVLRDVREKLRRIDLPADLVKRITTALEEAEKRRP